MAEITYEPTEWADFEQGGTPITAASLNHMEGGIAGAIRGVNTLTEDRLQTYRVSQDGDTATQDVSGNAIVGPCLIYDEAINGTYYEPSSDVGDRVLMVSANQIEALQDSVSQILPSKGLLSPGTDLDNIKTQGIYATQPGISNMPTGGDGWGVVVVFNPYPVEQGNCTQLYLGPLISCRWTYGSTSSWSGWT